MTDRAMAVRAKAARRKPPKVRGIFERPKASGLWWVRYSDASGREHREKAGTRGMALDMLAKRRAARLAGVKMPERLRAKAATFAEIAATGLEWSKAHKASWAGDVGRLRHVCAELGQRPAADITPQELERALRKLASDNAWAPSTFNRIKNVVSMTYRLALNNGKVTSNPARLVRQMRSDNIRLRFLSLDEESKLRAIIAADCPQHMPELDLSLNTGMRAGEQYGLTWEDVDFERRQIRLWPDQERAGAVHPAEPARLRCIAGAAAGVQWRGAGVHQRGHAGPLPRARPAVRAQLVRVCRQVGGA